MSDVEPADRERAPANDRATGTPPENRLDKRRQWGGRLFGLAVLLMLLGGLGFGGWRYNSQQFAVAATAERHRNFVPSVRAATVRANDGNVILTLPATTLAFTTANIYARASGYIDKRNADIGDRVKAGQLLVQITAPELEHQITQAQGTLVQYEASLQQAQANKELAEVTWKRDNPLVGKGWVTEQQGDIDRLTLRAREAAVGIAQGNAEAQRALVRVLQQQKAYQSVVAPFDGIITQRNVDVGTLVQADATSSTFMFTLMQGDVIRTQVYVPQDQAFGLSPGVDAVVHVAEIPGHTFPGKVTRIADALQPGTRTLLTEVDIPNPDGVLSPGTYCTVELHIPRKAPSLLVPADALIFNSGGLQVAVIEDGVARIRKISVARDLGKELEVRDGVKQGDQVILNPSVNLVEGSRVEARPNG